MQHEHVGGMEFYKYDQGLTHGQCTCILSFALGCVFVPYIHVHTVYVCLFVCVLDHVV